MPNRREFIALSGKSLAAGFMLSRSLARPEVARQPKVILFDAFPIFDARPIFALAEELFPGKGQELSAAWRTRQFEYTWLRNSMGVYKDFWQVTRDGLVFAARSLKMDLPDEKRDRLMDAYLQLRAWPDAKEALQQLRSAGIRLAFLSNFTVKMLQAAIVNSGLEGMFDRLLSTDAARAFKPDPRAYQIGLDAFRLKPREMLFAAFAGWDAAGATKFGYPTFWVNRSNQPAEELGVTPDGTGADLRDLVRLVIA